MRVRPFLVTLGSVTLMACADQSVIGPLGDRPSPIIAGNPDNGAHPYVGLIVFDDAQGPAWLCTGALLSSTIVLTAGHCTDGAVAARIWMDEVVQGNTEYPLSGATSYDGAAFTYPGYCVACQPGIGMLNWLTGDVGIVALNEAVPPGVVSSYVQLPTAGLAGTLPANSVISLVGYGDQVRLVGGGPPATAGINVRMKTTATLLSGKFFNAENLIRLSMTATHGKGGFCFGDSGGPGLVGSTNTAVSVNSYVTNGNCRGVGYAMRIDSPAILNWIRSFLP